MSARPLAAAVLSLALSVPAVAQPPTAAPDPAAANAAVKYWQAFGLLPALDKAQEKLLLEWDKAPLDAAALKLIEQSQNSLKYLHRGASLPRCDWALDYEDGISLLIPHLGKARTLAALAALRAKHAFGRGDAAAGWADVTALFKLARHIETDPIMIDQLVGYAIEAMAIQAVAPHLPAAKTGLADVAATLNRLPARPTFAQMLQAEKRTTCDWLVRELKAADRVKSGSWEVVWKGVFGGPGEGGGLPLPVPAAGSLDEAVKQIEALPPLYDELAKLTELPWAEFDARYPEFVKKSRAASPAAAAVLPSMEHVVAAQRRADARLALFKAAAAVVQGGPDRLAGIKDPFGDGPFGYTASDGGFELTSKLLFKGQPVSLAVGKK